MLKKLILLSALISGFGPINMSANVIAVSNPKELNAYINGSKITVVKFYAPWCSPCQRLNGPYAQLEKAYGNKLNFLTVNIDAAKKLKKQFGVNSVPQILFFKGGHVVYSIKGAKLLDLQLKVEEFASL